MKKKRGDEVPFIAFLNCISFSFAFEAKNFLARNLSLNFILLGRLSLDFVCCVLFIRRLSKFSFSLGW